MDEQTIDVLTEQQQEVVDRYAVRIREAATGGRVDPPSIGASRRCYELLNECAMELARLTRRHGGNTIH